eukprot:TRINITY_DN22434_c0_g2_i1.p2 TRINITY_DN22434_c0_g2~~TRINITY_DN22434_c0_g2_i1.p2  ORF type:complete len:371 (+),score=105.62 TRINITY_DN22434_c0_g2_i1:83-1114(+)
MGAARRGAALSVLGAAACALAFHGHQRHEPAPPDTPPAAGTSPAAGAPPARDEAGEAPPGPPPPPPPAGAVPPPAGGASAKAVEAEQVVRELLFGPRGDCCANVSAEELGRPPTEGRACVLRTAPDGDGARVSNADGCGNVTTAYRATEGGCRCYQTLAVSRGACPAPGACPGPCPDADALRDAGNAVARELGPPGQLLRRDWLRRRWLVVGDSLALGFGAGAVLRKVRVNVADFNLPQKSLKKLFARKNFGFTQTRCIGHRHRRWWARAMSFLGAANGSAPPAACEASFKGVAAEQKAMMVGKVYPQIRACGGQNSSAAIRPHGLILQLGTNDILYGSGPVL